MSAATVKVPRGRALTVGEKKAFRWGYATCQAQLIEQLSNSRAANGIAGHVRGEPEYWVTTAPKEGGA